MGPAQVSQAEPLDRRLVRIVLVAMLALGTLWFFLGEDDVGRTTHVPRADGDYYYVYLPSVWLDGDLDLGNQYQVSGNWYRTGNAPTGKPGNFFGVGPAVFTTPLFLVGHGVARVTGARGDGFSRAEQTLVAWGSLVASVFAVLFAYRLAARRLGAPRSALAGAVLVFLGGPVVYYAIRQPGYAHPFATLFAAWLVDAWDASYDRPRTTRTWAGLGALLGCAILARPQLATWGVLLGAAGLDDLIASRGRAAPRIALALAIAIACVVPQLVAWKVIYGKWWLVPQGEGFLRWDAPKWLETLFSSRNGLLPWAPIYAVGIAGLVVAARRLPRLAIAMLAAIFAQAMVNGAAWDWWGGGSFGGRRFDSIYVAIGFGVAVVVAHAARALAARAWWRRALGGVGLAWLGALAISNAVLAGMYSPHTARIVGGRAAWSVMREKLGVLGEPAAAASALSNLPSRAWFAWRHGTSLDAYDVLVGVHWLGDTYPGLNSNPPVRDQTRDLGSLPPEEGAGFAHTRIAGWMTIARGRARVIIPLNRRGGVDLVATAWNPDGGTLALDWNDGDARASAELSAAPRALTLHATHVERGVNELVITAPPGTVIAPLGVHGLGPD